MEIEGVVVVPQMTGACNGSSQWQSFGQRNHSRL
jgi:hypothetical protein